MSDKPERLAVFIREEATGTIAVHQAEFYKEPGRPVTLNNWIWAKGNFSCDCNRQLFFYRAIHQGEPDQCDIDCGETQYRVRVIDHNGIIHYDEWSPKP